MAGERQEKEFSNSTRAKGKQQPKLMAHFCSSIGLACKHGLLFNSLNFA